MSVFSELDGKLSEAVVKQDTQTVSTLLSEDYEMRVGAMPGSPIPRADWIRQSFSEPRSSSVMEQMAVHDFSQDSDCQLLMEDKVHRVDYGHRI